MRTVILGLLVAGLCWAQEPAGEAEKKPEEAVEEKGEEKAQEGEEMVVTAERMETPRRLSGESYTVVTAEDLQIRQDDDLHEAIRMSPGIHVAQTGSKGGLSSLFVRGGESDHALLLVDGMEVNSDGGGVDLAIFTIDGAGRLEIVRGAGSSVWGADSMSGTVHLMTKRGSGKPRVWISAEAGNFSTMRERLRYESGDDTYGVNLVISRYDRWDGRWDHSDYRNTTVAGRFDYAIGEATTIKATVRYIAEEAEQFGEDPGPAFVVEDPNGLKEEDDLILGLEVAHKLADWWSVTLRAGRFDEDVRFDNLGSFDFDSTSDFERTKAGLQTDAAVIDTEDFKYIVTAGGEWEREELTTSDSFSGGLGTNEKRNNRGFYVQNRLEAWGRLGLVLSGRVDSSGAFGTAKTGRAALTYDIEEIGTRPHASIANGIKTPTMTESFSTNPFFLGNRDLDPEKSRTIDVGVEQRIAGHFLKADLTFFENRMFDLIAFTGGTPAFANAGHARARGWEFSLEARPLDWLRISGGWTYQRTRVTHSETTSLVFQEGERLIRRPDNAGYAEVGVEFFYEDEIPEAQRHEHPRFSASLHAQYVGNRDDVLFFSFPDSPARIRNNDYLKVDFATEWWVVDRAVRVFGSVENLADTDYQEVAGWPNDPVNFLIGMEFTFGVPELKRKGK
ncbi:MAG: TonB-dependent receptor [Planctomycetes bacterium]|nr:TonB-dependent receptor [Planctomycetota bacterium]